MNCIVQIRILRFFILSKTSLRYNRILTSLSWLNDGRYLSMLIESFIRIFRMSLKNWHRRKKGNVVSASMLQEHNGFKLSSKLCRNLCSRKRLSPNLNLVTISIPTCSWMLKILFSLGLIKLYENFCKIGSSVYLVQVCSTPLWPKVKKILKILGPAIERSKCIWLSCGSSHGWNKAMDIFRDFAMKDLIK